MSTIKTVRVGIMPGRIGEVAVTEGSSIAEVLRVAELEVNGFEVKVDGAKVTDLEGTFVTSSTNLVLLSKQIKGNATRTVRVGMMPGRISEYAVDSEQSIASVLEMAELNADGYEVKLDGSKATDLSQPVGSANLILLAKLVKGNATKTIRVGVMPGRIQEYAVDSQDSVQSVLAVAELDPTGYEVKLDGTKVIDLSQPVGTGNLILLAKQVKGNKTL